MAAESHQSPRASSREVVVLARRQHEATVGPHSYSVEAQPERGRREAPHANSPRATKSSRRRTSIGGAVACALAAAGMPKASGGRSAQNASEDA
eukprot:COSAG06_NODE_48614_length_330_cov_70.307359_1_plen_93_part_01